MLTGWGVRRLPPGRNSAVRRALEADPIASCVLAEVLESSRPGRLSGGFFGLPGPEGALIYLGGNAFPVRGQPDEMHTLGRVLGRRSRPASVLGYAHLVLPFWQGVQERWGPAREVRANQPLLHCAAPPQVAADPGVRRAVPEDLERYFPAAVQMFTAEVGVSPVLDGEAPYRSRIRGLIGSRRAFVRFDDGAVSFKAEIGALSSRAAMIQGVWVAPHLRGRGMGAPAMAAVVGYIQELGLVPCLYVNDYNTAARRIYQQVGFTQIGTFATVLF